MIGTVNSVASSDGCEDYMMKYIKLTSATHKGNQCETKGDTKTTNASSNETLLKFYKNHFFDAEVPQRKKQLLNRLILENYPKYNKKTICASLIGNKDGKFNEMKKIVRFWGRICEHVYPSIYQGKYCINLFEKNYRNNSCGDIKGFNSVKNAKLPKLYTNSSLDERMRLKKFGSKRW